MTPTLNVKINMILNKLWELNAINASESEVLHELLTNVGSLEELIKALDEIGPKHGYRAAWEWWVGSKFSRPRIVAEWAGQGSAQEVQKPIANRWSQVRMCVHDDAKITCAACRFAACEDCRKNGKCPKCDRQSSVTG